MSFQDFVQSMFVNSIVSISFLFVLGLRIWIKRPLQTGILMMPIFIGLIVYAGDHLALLQTGGMINWISFLSGKLRLLYLCVFYVTLLEVVNLGLSQLEMRRAKKNSAERGAEGGSGSEESNP